MKRIISLVILGLLTFNCKDKSVSSEECTPVVDTMLENFSSLLKDKPEEEIQQMKNLTKPILQKECESGKYKLDCLKTAKSLEELQTCKN